MDDLCRISLSRSIVESYRGELDHLRYPRSVQCFRSSECVPLVGTFLLAGLLPCTLRRHNARFGGVRPTLGGPRIVRRLVDPARRHAEPLQQDPHAMGCELLTLVY